MNDTRDHGLSAVWQRLRRNAAELASRFTDTKALLLATGGIALCGIAAGLIVAYGPDPSVVRQLERYSPSVVTVLYDESGEPYAEWFLERRQLITYGEIPVHMRQALLAAEDASFFWHVGVDPFAVMRAAIANVTGGWGSQGAGTLTMQLSRNLWLEPDKRMSRKIKEAFFAVQIERQYTKEQIFELYANQIFIGNENANIHGLQAAADYYLGKPLQEVDLSEAALLAGLIQRPAGYNPYKYPERALRRRDFILQRMVDEDFIGQQEAGEAIARPLELGGATEPNTIGRYLTEDIRRELIKRFGYDAIYKGGLHVYTTLNRDVQIAAERALDAGLRAVDKRQGWRGAARNLPAEGIDPEQYEDDSWRETPAAGEIVVAVVVAVAPERARVRIGDRVATLEPDDAGWTGVASLDRLLHVGDLIEVLIEEVGEDGELELELEQDPAVEGAVLVFENHTGEIEAMVGGQEFDDSEFNRAKQAVRQTGSVFKPFVYTAAIDHGLSPADLVVDQPSQFEDPTTRQVYAPRNFGNEYVGITTLAEAMFKSRNVSAVKVMQRVGGRQVVETARRMGVTAPLQPYLSLALGVFDLSLWEVTRAYSVFPNQGVLVEPHMIRSVTDREGRPVHEAERKAQQVLDDDVAYVVTRMMRNVVQHGTGIGAAALARELEMPLAGKTGTTNDYSDAWFVGYSPYHTVGVWVGHDEKEKIGRLETGSRAALPIWKEVMAVAARDLEPATFERSGDVVLRTIDRHTGLLASDVCNNPVELAFLSGTQPTEVCTAAHHRILSLPYYYQAYYLQDGRLRTSMTPMGVGYDDAERR